MMSTKSPDLFSFTVTGLRDIMDKHGDQSTQAADASDLVNNFINKVLHNVIIKKNCFVCSHLPSNTNVHAFIFSLFFLTKLDHLYLTLCIKFSTCIRNLSLVRPF